MLCRHTRRSAKFSCNAVFCSDMLIHTVGSAIDYMLRKEEGGLCMITWLNCCNTEYAASLVNSTACLLRLPVFAPYSLRER